ncbi:hypothetical protein ACFL26_00385 [Patescibacteria group bacterium]
MEMRQIDFPAEEHEPLQQQFDHFSFAYTTRVSSEVGKYEVGNVLMTPWGRRVRVSEVREFSGVDNHPYLNELTEAQRALVGKHDKRYEVIKLDLV